ncbi:MAG: winged helix-turn-helix domain-containing protein [Burkholderiales bacterium]|nr:winged helix-turn-helix domain-containing protein [Burkholderiales bacterium]
MASDLAWIGRRGHGGLRVGPWTIDRMLNRVRRGNECVRLEPKAMELLAYLAERPGEVVTRDALLAAVWPGVVVGDDALTQAVIKLRRALGDTADEPAFIETIPKRGYRLIAPVAIVPGAQAPVAAEAAAAGARPPARRRRAPWIASLTALVAAGAIALAWLVAGAYRRDAALPDVLSTLPADLSQLAAQPAIVVTPLEVIGDDPRLAVLARGLATDLTTDLSNAPGLTVLREPGRSRIEAGRAAAAAFPARYVVSGSVQGDAERLRVNMRLADAQSGRQLWSERFERPAGDVFAMQDDLVTRILAVLPVRVNEADRWRAARRYTRNLEAYELFHRAQLAFGAREKGQNAAASELYWRAIGLDPAFARAYAGVAMTHAMSFRHQWASDGRRALAKAQELAESAHRMAPESVETLWVLAYVQWHRREYPAALQLLKEALRLNPSYGDAYGLMGDIYTDLGRPADGITLLRAGMRLTPNPGATYHLLLGRAYYFLGDLEQARVNLLEAINRNPAHVEAHLFMAVVAARSGDRETALWHTDEIRALRPDFAAREWLGIYPLSGGAERDALRRELELLGF